MYVLPTPLALLSSSFFFRPFLFFFPLVVVLFTVNARTRKPLWYANRDDRVLIRTIQRKETTTYNFTNGMCKIIRKGYNHNHSNCTTISAPFLNNVEYTLYRPRLSHHVFQFFVLFYDFRFIILHNTCNIS